MDGGIAFLCSNICKDKELLLLRQHDDHLGDHQQIFVVFNLLRWWQMCAILSDTWSLFSEAKLNGTKLQDLGFCPPKKLLKKFWKLCEYRLSAPGAWFSSFLPPCSGPMCGDWAC